MTLLFVFLLERFKVNENPNRPKMVENEVNLRGA